MSTPAVTFPSGLGNIAPGFQRQVEDSEQVDKEVVRLREQNPLFTVYGPEWELYLSAYEGGPDFCKAENLFKHTRENEDDYTDRVNRLHYLNYCEPLVDFFTNFIFTETIARDGGKNSDFYTNFINNVNRKGDNVVDFMKMVSDDMQIFGMSYVLVDTPRIKRLNGEDQPLSQAQVEEQGIRPYWVLIKPNEVIDWVTDEFEVLEYLKRCQPIAKNVSGTTRQFEKYTEWYTDHIVISVVDVTNSRKPELVSQEALPNSLGKIPIEVIRHKRSKRYRYMGNSFLRDFAYNNREVMNLTSLLQEFLYRQAFNILAKETDGNVPFRDQADGAIGTANVLEYPKGADAPTYISPPADPAQFIAEERQRLINEMFKRASQDMMSELFNGEKSSGFSQAQSFSKTVPFIATRADNLEKAENALMALTMQLQGQKWDGTVKYKDRYELTNITDAITQLTSVFRDLMMPSETFVKTELWKLVQELDGKIPQDDLLKIKEEIESMDFEEWQQNQLDALVGKGGGTSPAEQQGSKSTGTMAEAAAEANNTPSATKKLQSKKQKR
jgi:hypothetical protein